jgi:hypothetical protein
MNDRRNQIEIDVKTNGFEEATEKVEALADAYDSFPPQVQIKNCRDCTFHIHPSQIQMTEAESEDE